MDMRKRKPVRAEFVCVSEEARFKWILFQFCSYFVLFFCFLIGSVFSVFLLHNEYTFLY